MSPLRTRFSRWILSLLWCGALIPATFVFASTPIVVTAATATDKPAEKLSDKPTDKPVASLPTIALVLPLSSKTLSRAAEALRDGFIAATEVSGKEKYSYKIYLAEDEGDTLAAQYRKAVEDGAVAVIGGITREGANVVAREAGYLPTLALNTPTDATRLEANQLFHISLGLENDARQIARAAAQEGLRRVMIMQTNVGNVAMARRIVDAFEKEWLRTGGTIASKLTVSGDLHESARLRTTLAKSFAAPVDRTAEKPQDKEVGKDTSLEKSLPDFLFMAADIRAARIIRPYLPAGVPVYTTTQAVNPSASALENLDLDGVRYLDMPWFAERDHLAVVSYPRPPETTSTDYERLYALGIDAWRVMLAMMAKPTASPATTLTPRQAAREFVPIDGVTGRITLDKNHMQRTLTLIELRDGKPTVVKSAE
jgi:uncharacterized protein